MTCMHQFMGCITPSLTCRYFDDTRVFTSCRYWSPLQRDHTCSNSCSSISAPCFVVRPVSGRLISHILMSSIPVSQHSLIFKSCKLRPPLCLKIWQFESLRCPLPPRLFECHHNFHVSTQQSPQNDTPTTWIFPVVQALLTGTTSKGGQPTYQVSSCSVHWLGHNLPSLAIWAPCILWASLTPHNKTVKNTWHNLLKIYTVSQIKRGHFIFHHKFYSCWDIFIIPSPFCLAYNCAFSRILISPPNM